MLKIVKDITRGFGAPQDDGIAVQSMLLGAVEKGFWGCIIGNLDRKKLKEALDLYEKYEISLVLALGYPKEEVVIENIGDAGDIKYWRGENQVHHIPKRTLDDLIL